MRSDNEHSIQQRIQIAWTKLGHRLFRVNSGTAWVGKPFRPPRRMDVSVSSKDLVLYDCRPFHAGFVGAPDLWGWRRVVITPDMVGQTVAIFAAVEVKGPKGKQSKEQQAFLDLVSEMGGHARLARSVEESL